MTIVTEAGFSADDWSRAPGAPLSIAPYEELGSASSTRAIDLPNDVDPAELAPKLDQLDLIAVAFPNSGDGRGFSLARRLRALGFRGRLRAVGAVLPDQFAYALACGFDEVELDAERAARQPEAHWRAAAERPAGGYQARVFAG